MIALEKLRAICQQMPAYAPNWTPSARARDFFDIYQIHAITGFRIGSPGNKNVLRHIFAAKEVPLEFLQLIAAQREFHRPDWDCVRLSINNDNLKEFDFAIWGEGEYPLLELCDSLFNSKNQFNNISQLKYFL